MASRKIGLGDTVRVAGHEGIVTGTMTSHRCLPGGVIERSVCISVNGPRTAFLPPTWHPVEDVELVAKAERV